MNNVDQEAAAGVPPSDPRVIVISQPATRELPSGSKTFEHIVNLVKALVWPLLIAIFFLVYRDTAGQIADQLPGLMAHVTKVSGGGLAVEIQQQAQQAGGMRLSNVVTSLDGGDIQQILKIGCATGVLSALEVNRTCTRHRTARNVTLYSSSSLAEFFASP
jgi:hypothetical protein